MLLDYKPDLMFNSQCAINYTTVGIILKFPASSEVTLHSLPQEYFKCNAVNTSFEFILVQPVLHNDSVF